MVLYLCPPSGADVISAMEAGLIGAMTTPMQGNVLPAGVPIGVDNGKFGEGWVGHEAWLAFVADTVAKYGRDRILWATAPDEPFDPDKTLRASLPWLPEIQALGVRAAFVAQNGSERGLIPWGTFEVLFIGGGPECLPCGYVKPPKADRKQRHCPYCRRLLTEWKTSVAARGLIREALDRGLDAHMGRVNGAPRLIRADEWGCASADGTCVARGPLKNLRRIKGWLPKVEEARRARAALLRDQPLLFAEEEGMPGQDVYLPEQWTALVAERQRVGVEKTFIAEQLGVSTDLITYWETGQIPIPFYMAVQYAGLIDGAISFGTEPSAREASDA